jgi:hypothetical protein
LKPSADLDRTRPGSAVAEIWSRKLAERLELWGRQAAAQVHDQIAGGGEGHMPGKQIKLERLQNVALERGKGLRGASLLRNVTRQPGHRGTPGSAYGSAPTVPAEICQPADISVGEYPDPNCERNLAAQRDE